MKLFEDLPYFAPSRFSSKVYEIKCSKSVQIDGLLATC